MSKTFCLRFDVDTPLCISKGTINLINLADELNIKLTFFFNMGRAVSRKEYLTKSLRNNKKENVQKLSNLHKLGLTSFIYTALINPYVGKNYLKVIKLAEQKGHEIGLHGGKNHADWQCNARNWSESRFKEEVAWSLDILRKADFKHITSFASPGWEGPETLFPVLKTLGFGVVADSHGNNLCDINKIEGFLIVVPVNISGEPGGVGYLEHCRAKRMSDEEIIEHFKLNLSKKDKFAVMYDHPYYAGIKELPLLVKLISTAQNMGFEIKTISQLAKDYEDNFSVSKI